MDILSSSSQKNVALGRSTCMKLWPRVSHGPPVHCALFAPSGSVPRASRVPRVMVFHFHNEFFKRHPGAEVSSTSEPAPPRSLLKILSSFEDSAERKAATRGLLPCWVENFGFCLGSVVGSVVPIPHKILALCLKQLLVLPLPSSFIYIYSYGNLFTNPYKQINKNGLSPL
jgi:hypothetical protein